MKILFLLLLTSLLFLNSGLSQNYFIKFFSDTANVSVSDLQITADSNLVLFGNIVEPIPGQLIWGINFICVDTAGQLKFVKRYFGGESNIVFPVGRVAGQNFLLSGSTQGIHASLYKTDSLGIIQFSTGYGDTLNWTIATDALLLQSGHTLSLELNRDFVNDNNFDLVIAKFDMQGNMLFCKRLDIGYHDLSKKICMVRPNEFLVSGTAGDLQHNDILLLKIDSDANVAWCKQYLNPFSNLEVIDFIHTDDGSNYFLLSTWDVSPNDSYTAVLKIDSSGQALWLYRLLCPDNFSGSHIKLIKGNLLIAGNLKIETDTNEIRKGVFLEMDSTGQLLWAKSLILYGNNTLSAACALNGSIYLAGSVSVDPTLWDYFFISKTFEGNILGCEEELYEHFSVAGYQITDTNVQVTVNPFGKQYVTNWQQAESGTLSNYCSDNSIYEVSNSLSLTIYPNPATDFLIFDLGNFSTSHCEISLYNSIGQLLHHFSSLPSSQLSAESLVKISVNQIRSDGIYFYTLKLNDEKVFSGKFLIQQ